MLYPDRGSHVGRRVILGGLFLFTGVAAVKTQGEQAQAALSAISRLFTPREPEVIGIHNGSVEVIRDLPGFNPLRFRTLPVLDTRTEIPILTTAAELEIFRKRYLENFELSGNRWGITLPEIVMGENPDTGKENTGYWIKLDQLIRRRAYSRTTMDTPPVVYPFTSYISVSHDTQEHVRLDKPLELIKKGRDGRYYHPGTTTPIDPSKIGVIQEIR